MMFVKGPITTNMLNDAIVPFSKNSKLGAYTIFMGQIRADRHNGQHVVAIDYTAYESMALKVINIIKNKAIQQFDILDIAIYHSLGIVNIGEVSLMIIVGSAHRKACLSAQEYTIESIKNEVPIFGKELLEQGDFVWKENK